MSSAGWRMLFGIYDISYLGLNSILIIPSRVHLVLQTSDDSSICQTYDVLW